MLSRSARRVVSPAVLTLLRSKVPLSPRVVLIPESVAQELAKAEAHPNKGQIEQAGDQVREVINAASTRSSLVPVMCLAFPPVPSWVVHQVIANALCLPAAPSVRSPQSECYVAAIPPANDPSLFTLITDEGNKKVTSPRFFIAADVIANLLPYGSRQLLESCIFSFGDPKEGRVSSVFSADKDKNTTMCYDPNMRVVNNDGYPPEAIELALSDLKWAIQESIKLGLAMKMPPAGNMTGVFAVPNRHGIHGAEALKPGENRRVWTTRLGFQDHYHLNMPSETPRAR